MAAPTKSRWGALLSQAVAGVEARLDDILADKDDVTKEQKPAAATPPPPPAASVSATPPTKSPPIQGPVRTASNPRAADRLQERLARAVAARSTTPTGGKPDAATPSKGPDSLPQSPRDSIEVASRPSTDSAPSSAPAPLDSLALRTSQDTPQTTTNDVVDDGGKEENVSGEVASSNGTAVQPNGALDSSEDATETQDEQAHPQNGVADIEKEAIEPPASESTPTAAGEEDERAKKLDRALEEALLQYQEETHAYVEQIDALQAKLQYLSRETTEAARKAAQAAPAGSMEKKLAEKDEQIALLMEEGKVLASTEQKHRTIIKKLRARTVELEKDAAEVQAAKAKVDSELEGQRRRAKRVDELEKTRDELDKRLDQAQKDLATARSESATKDNQIAELKTQLRRESQQSEALAAKVNEEARDQDRRRIAELEESVAALQVEKTLVADRAKQQTNDWMQKAERAAERSRTLELEMKAELQAMEGKLEAMRAVAEEASSGAVGDSQAKLLRQVETLQTQYSVASDNWQGIEATLLARVAGLERERDEAQQRETEVRRKAREAALRAKRNEEELEEAKTRLPTIQEDVRSYQSKLEALQKRAEDAEAVLQDTKAEHEKQRQAWKEELGSNRVESQGRNWLEDLPSATGRSQSRPDSPNPLMAQSRTFSSDLVGLQSLSSKMRKPSAPSSSSDLGTAERVLMGNRRPSVLPLAHNTAALSPGASAASTSSPFSATPYDALPTPSREAAADRDDMFEGVETSSSPHQVMQDMVSVSTVAAGPSVQLVERMSAAIRRLESEKVAAREELTRVLGQRDEARAEIVAMMRTVESGRTATAKVAGLQAEVAEINARYQTTLEMLGEKSELVDELRADVEDVKAMYRDLVERTVR